LEASREALARSASEATRLGEEIARQQAQQQALLAEAAEIVGSNAPLKVQMQRLADRIRQLDAAEAVCPVCNRPLGPDERRRALDDDRAEGQRLKDEYRANETRVVALRAEADQCGQLTGELQRQRERAELDARKEARLEEQLKAAQQAQTDMAAVQVALVDVTERLQREEFALAERATLRRLTGEIAALAFDDAAHEAAAADERRLSGYAQLLVDVQEAERRLPDVQTRHADYVGMRDELRERQTRDTATADSLRQAVALLSDLRAREADLGARLDEERRQRAEIERSLGRVQVQLEVCRAAREALVSAEADHRRLTDERELLMELTEAYGRKGIQAMIIETVVPELQDEANELLDRMPGNTMHVEFRTQRDTRTGEARETLDVVIRDDLGERRYENYSGGEQFRVNFAIRVALSKLLTRRAGAQLQMLVIDEGFGTQDVRGREGLIEAIRSVEQYFATVLVITHLPDIRDEFPTQVAVLKGLDGSTVSVR
jgi:exonuclease SbcC